MKNIEKLKEKKESIQNKINHIENKINKKSIENKKEILPPICEMLVVIVARGRGQAVFNYLKSININLNIVSFGEGTAPSNIAGLLGFSQEKEVVMSVINSSDSDRVLDLLDSIFLSTEKYSGIAFTIPLKSLTFDTLNTFKKFNNSKNNGGKD